MSPSLSDSGASAWLLLATLLATALAMAMATVWAVRFLGRRPRVREDAPIAPAQAPGWWRLMAWIIEPLAAHLGPWLSARARRVLGDRLRRGGLETCLDADRFIAGVVVAAAVAALVAAVAGSALGGAPAFLVLACAGVGTLLPRAWLADRVRARERAVLRQLPFLLDVITLAVQAGMNLSSALAQAADKTPAGPLRDEVGRLLRDLRAGRARAEALRAMGDRVALPALTSLVSALIVAEQQGSALAPLLRAQAEQRRNERFLRAEKLAMEAPVKMLLPLLVFIFPCTFAVLLFPILGRMLLEGWLK